MELASWLLSYAGYETMAVTLPVEGSVTTTEPEHGSSPKSPGVNSRVFIFESIKSYAVIPPEESLS